MYELLQSELEAIHALSFLRNVHVTLIKQNENPPAGCALTSVNELCSVFLLVRGMVDIDAEVKKLEEKLAKSSLLRDDLQKKISVPEYEKRVRADVQEINAGKLKAFDSEIDGIQTAIQNFLKLQ